MTQMKYEQIRKQRAAHWKHLVRRTGKTQRYWAGQIEIDLATFNRILTGTTEPRIATLTRMAEALGLPMAAMFLDDGQLQDL